MMRPCFAPGSAPPFHDLPEYQFQNLCRDLFAREKGIATCDVYGPRGQAQRGIDLLALRDDDAVEVGQCKRYRTARPPDIRAATDEFLKHFEHWRSRKVSRFILFVACDLERTQLIEELLAQRARFAQVGISYQCWSAATIANKLRDEPGIVRAHLLTDYWVQTICGWVPPAAESAAGAQRMAVVDSALIAQSAQLGERIGAALERELERAREAWREGRRNEATDWLRATKSDTVVWGNLSPSTRARLLRFEASLVLDETDDPERAHLLLNEAHELAPDAGDARLAALIALRTHGAEAALSLLGTEEDTDSLNLRAAILLELDRVDNAWIVLNRLGGAESQNPETLRLSALAHFVTGETDEALLTIRKATELRPAWQSIQVVDALLAYYSGLSPAGAPRRPPAWPEPVDWVLVRRDDESTRRRRLAADSFGRLAVTHTNDIAARQRFEVWRLACLATDPERREEAVAYCRELLQAYPAHDRVIAWAVARRYEVDLRASERALATLTASGTATVLEILALVHCYWATGKPSKAVKLLERSEERFRLEGVQTLWTLWRVQALVMNGQVASALPLSRGAEATTELRPARAMALRAQAGATGDWGPAISFLEASYESSRDPQFLLELCEAAAQQQNWSYAADRAQELVSLVATSDSLRLAAAATFNAGRFELCLHLLQEHRGLFPGDRLPNELRQLLVACHRRLGVLPEAISAAQQLVQDEPSAGNLLSLMSLYLDKGDPTSAVAVARRLLDRPDLRSEDALRVAGSLFVDDVELAQAYWRRSDEGDLPDDAVSSALQLAFRLGLEREARSLDARAAAMAREGRGRLRFGTTKDMLAVGAKQRAEMGEALDLYRRGEITIHQTALVLRRPLVDFYHAALADNLAHPNPLHQFAVRVRHGGRPLTPGFPKGPFRQLFVDLTAILLAHQLGILPAIERIFRPVYLPGDLTRALLRDCCPSQFR